MSCRQSKGWSLRLLCPRCTVHTRRQSAQARIGRSGTLCSHQPVQRQRRILPHSQRTESRRCCRHRSGQLCMTRTKTQARSHPPSTCRGGSQRRPRSIGSRGPRCPLRTPACKGCLPCTMWLDPDRSQTTERSQRMSGHRRTDPLCSQHTPTASWSHCPPCPGSRQSKMRCCWAEWWLQPAPRDVATPRPQNMPGTESPDRRRGRTRPYNITPRSHRGHHRRRIPQTAVESIRPPGIPRTLCTQVISGAFDSTEATQRPASATHLTGCGVRVRVRRAGLTADTCIAAHRVARQRVTRFLPCLACQAVGAGRRWIRVAVH
jgi:hypothetical protein